MQNKVSGSAIAAALLGAIFGCPSSAGAQMTNITNAGDTVIGPLPEGTKVLTAEEAKTLGSQSIGTGSGSSVVQPTGVYTQIDTTKSMQLIKELREPDGPQAKRDIAEIKRKPGSYTPPVLISMAVAEFNSGDVADAAFWLHAGLLRSVLDTKISADPSVGDSPRFLLLQTPQSLRKAALADPVQKAKLAHAAAVWDANTPMTYDHRWIALHSIQATMSAFDPDHAPKTLTIPQLQWSETAKKNRADYEAQMSSTPPPAPAAR